MSLRLQILTSPLALNAAAWDGLLAAQARPTPFMRSAYLQALHASGSAVPATGWAPHFFLLREGSTLVAACAVYLKSHSWGEYVFDFAWAKAYAHNGLAYYPKAVIAVPFTPVPGSRLLARDADTRTELLRQVLAWCQERGVSSLHVLFGDAADMVACGTAGLLMREQVEFHWHNAHPDASAPFADFEDFLTSLNRDKRKKIRQERKHVLAAGVRFRAVQGAAITPVDWAFFYRCYRQTYLEHGNAPYLTPDFFAHMARDMPDHWLLFIGERGGTPMACSLVALNTAGAADLGGPRVAYGRYWGALERVDCLHFEACYYQPIAWCITHGVTRFEGGAQGEHKLARGLLPAMTRSAHWLAHPAFAAAVADYLDEEREEVEHYRAVLDAHTPFRR